MQEETAAPSFVVRILLLTLVVGPVAYLAGWALCYAGAISVLGIIIGSINPPPGLIRFMEVVILGLVAIYPLVLTASLILSNGYLKYRKVTGSMIKRAGFWGGALFLVASISNMVVNVPAITGEPKMWIVPAAICAMLAEGTVWP